MKQEHSYVPFLEDCKNPFSTYDMGMCAALVSVGYHLMQIDKSTGSKALFVFESCDEIIESANQYWMGELHGDLLSYFNALKTIKNRLYSS